MKKRKILSEFKHEGVEFKLVQPTVKIMKEAKHRHTKVFTDCLKEGFYTKRKLEAELSEGDFDVVQDHINRRAEILKLFTETQEQLDGSEDPAQIEYLAEMLSLYRSSLVQEDNSMNIIYSNTADQMAEDERLNFLIYSLIKKEDLSNVWQNYSEFEEDPDFDFTESCRYHLMCWEYSLNPDWEENLPETAAKKRADKIRKDIIKEMSTEDKTVKKEKKPRKPSPAKKKPAEKAGTKEKALKKAPAKKKTTKAKASNQETPSKKEKKTK